MHAPYLHLPYVLCTHTYHTCSVLTSTIRALYLHCYSDPSFLPCHCLRNPSVTLFSGYQVSGLHYQSILPIPHLLPSLSHRHPFLLLYSWLPHFFISVSLSYPSSPLPIFLSFLLLQYVISLPVIVHSNIHSLPFFLTSLFYFFISYSPPSVQSFLLLFLTTPINTTHSSTSPSPTPSPPTPNQHYSSVLQCLKWISSNRNTGTVLLIYPYISLTIRANYPYITP
jgi:hypothetical protein